MRPACVLLTVFLAHGVPPSGGAEAADSAGEPLPPGAVQRLGTLRMRYPGGVGGLAYLPDGRGVVLTGGFVDIWDLAKGVLLSHTRVSGSGLRGIDLRPDGKALLLADAAGKVTEWDPAALREVRSWQTTHGKLLSARYSPGAARMLTAGEDPPGLKEWDLASGKELLSVQSQMVSIRPGAIYGPEGKTAILGGGYDHNLEHYDLATGRLLKKWCTIYQAKCLALSPDQKYLTVGVEDRAVEWSLAEYSEFHPYKHCPGEAARIFSVAYVPASNEVLCGGRDGSIHRWSRATGQRAFSWTPHQSEVSFLCLSPDGKWVLSYGTRQVTETNIETGENRLPLQRHVGSVEAVAFLPSGKQVVSASSDATLRLWEVESGKQLRSIAGAKLGAYAVAVSPDGSRVAAGCKDGVVREFSPADAKLLRELTGHLGYIRAVTYTPDGKRLLSSADDGSIRVWLPERPEPAAVLQGHRGGVLSLSVSPDGRRLLSGGRDATVRLWDLATAKLLRTFEGSRGWVSCVAFTPDGAHAFSGGRDGRIRKWNLESGKGDGELLQGSWIYSLACFPDGRRVAATGADGKIVCWDVETAKQVTSFAGHQGAVTCLAVSGDGQRLVSGSQDTTLLVWGVP